MGTSVTGGRGGDSSETGTDHLGESLNNRWVYVRGQNKLLQEVLYRQFDLVAEFSEAGSLMSFFSPGT